MKSKFLFFSTMISACVLSFACNNAAADERHPDFPRGGQKCYPGNFYHSNKKNESVTNNKQQTTAPKKLKMNSIDNFQGTVKSIERDRHPDGRIFIQIVLETKEGEKNIHVGLASYVDRSNLRLQPGDKIKVTGYSIKVNGEEVITAKEINKNGKVLRLLNDKRQPLWGNDNRNQNRNQNRNRRR